MGNARAGSRTEASSTTRQRYVPAETGGDRSGHAASFPTPPGPVSVTHPRRAVAQQVDDPGDLIGAADQRRRIRLPSRRHGRSGADGVLEGTVGQQRLPFGDVELEGVGERPNGMRVGTAPDSSLQGTDGRRRQPGARGQLLLG